MSCCSGFFVFCTCCALFVSYLFHFYLFCSIVVYVIHSNLLLINFSLITALFCSIFALPFLSDLKHSAVPYMTLSNCKLLLPLFSVSLLVSPAVSIAVCNQICWQYFSMVQQLLSCVGCQARSNNNAGIFVWHHLLLLKHLLSA